MRILIIFFLSLLMGFNNKSQEEITKSENAKTINSSCTQKLLIKTRTVILRFPENKKERERDTAKWIPIKNSTDFYDINGKLIRTEIYELGGSITNYYTISGYSNYQYNIKGKLEYLRTNYGDFRYYYNSNDSIKKIEFYDDGNLLEVTNYSYGDNNIKQVKKEEDDGVKIKQINNICNKSNQITVTEFSEEGIYYKTTYEYDNLGNIILMKSFEDNQLIETHKLIYNHGKLIREEINGESNTVHLYNEQGQLIKTNSGNSESLYKYNNSGLLISTFVYYDNNLFEIERYLYDFY